MKFTQFPSSPALAPYIREFLILESDLSFDSRTVPDTAIVMTFRYNGNIHKIEGEKMETLSAAGLSGLRKTVRRFQYAEQTDNLLVIFNEGGINAFSKLPAHELFEINTTSENIFHAAELKEIIERLAEADTNSDRISIIETFFRKKLITSNKPDHLIGNALKSIKEQAGNIRIRELAASLYISQDAFGKRFRAIVGSTPKQYASIVRMRNLIKTYPSARSLTEASYEAGYFDQSHFIKDFRLFTGLTPKEFFRDGEYW